MKKHKVTYLLPENTTEAAEFLDDAEHTLAYMYAVKHWVEEGGTVTPDVVAAALEFIRRDDVFKVAMLLHAIRINGQ